MSRPYGITDDARLQRASDEYRRIAGAASSPLFRLQDAFDHNGFSIAEYCAGFAANIHAASVEKTVERWARSHDVWIPGVTEHCNDLASFLYPTTSADRLVAIGKNFAIDWYLNDTIGRERFAGLDAERKAQAEAVRVRLVEVSATMALRGPGSLLENACLNMLHDIQSASDARWFKRFQRMWIGNLQRMCRDGNARVTGEVPSVPEYLHTRSYVSGMHHTLALTEFAVNQYLDWSTLARHGTARSIERLWWLCALIGCGSNDLFSFEKEFVEHYADSNLVVVTLLNKPYLTLEQAIAATIARISAYMAEFLELAAAIPQHAPEPAVLAFVESSSNCVRATWAWQKFSPRYKFPRSLFAENRPIFPVDALITST